MTSSTQPAPSPVLRYETRDRKAYITLNRPRQMNALSSELMDALDAALLAAEADGEVLVIIIAGEGGKAFSAGRDLKERAGLDASGNHGRIDRVDVLNVCSKPVIAAIDGYCVAGGMELALRCDIRVATVQSTFGMPEPRRGLLSSYALHNLSRQIPLGEAMLIHLTGRQFGAQRAYDIGLIQALAPDRAAMLQEAEVIADEILLGAPLNIQAIKHIVKTGRNLPVEYSWKLARPIDDEIYKSEDRVEGPRAFAEKRKPVWKSR